MESFLKASKYRSDIDGLRAIAVLSVIIYHIKGAWLSGGFLGVDVFFVISGYLITGIIYSEILDNKFSLKSFYIRRMKRILPAFFFMVLLTIIFGYFILLPYDFYKLGFSAASTLFFISNFNFSLRSGGYFDSSAEEWPLLHTWSLAVEEQYYFIFPMLMLLMMTTLKLRSKLLVSLMVITVLSFYIATKMSMDDELSSWSYYMLLTRAGELLIGSMTAILLKQQNILLNDKIKTFLSVISLAIITLSFIYIDKTMVFPGVLALPVCLATACLIIFKSNFSYQVLSLRPLVNIGLLSYSLYLIHWPILAYAKYLTAFNSNTGHLSSEIVMVCIFLILIFSLISYFCIEVPFRTKQWSFKKSFINLLMAPSLIIGGMAIATVLHQGFYERFSNNKISGSMAFSHLNKSKCPSLVNLGCIGGDSSSEELMILYGNSHAEHYFDFFDRYAEKAGYKLELVATGGCGIANNSKKCSLVNNFFNSNYYKADIVVISQRWDSVLSNEKQLFLNSLQKLSDDLKKQNKTVVIMAQTPKWNISISKLWNCTRVFGKCDYKPQHMNDFQEANKVMRNFASQHEVLFWEPYSGVKNYYAPFDSLGRPLFFDDNHLSRYGSELMYKSYEFLPKEELRDLLNKRN